MADQTYEPEEEAVLLEAIHLGLPNPCCWAAVRRWMESPAAPDHVRQAPALLQRRVLQGLVVESGSGTCDACHQDFMERLRRVRERLRALRAKQEAAEEIGRAHV